MTEYDPMKLLSEQAVIGNNMPGGEVKHADEPYALDDLALASIGKKIPPRMAAELVRRGLVKSPPAPQSGYPVQVQGVYPGPHAYPPEPPMNQQLISDLQAKIAFLKEKLELCESKLTKKQRDEYKLDWMLKIAEAAGDDMMVAAGKGFQKQNDMEAAVQQVAAQLQQTEPPTQTEEPEPTAEEMTLDDILADIGDDDSDQEPDIDPRQIQEKLEDDIRGQARPV